MGFAIVTHVSPRCAHPGIAVDEDAAGRHLAAGRANAWEVVEVGHPGEERLCDPAALGQAAVACLVREASRRWLGALEPTGDTLIGLTSAPTVELTAEALGI